MSNKARRRPSWKSKEPPMYIDLLDENTDELMQTIIVRKGASALRRIIKRIGPEEAGKRLRQGFIDLAERYGK